MAFQENPDTTAHENTIEIELSEYHYWIIAQAISAAGTASHRHGMTAHARKFHEAEKQLFGAFEDEMTNSDEDDVQANDGDERIEWVHYDASVVQEHFGLSAEPLDVEMAGRNVGFAVVDPEQ